MANELASFLVGICCGQISIFLLLVFLLNRRKESKENGK